jgi:hypothetical protein
MDKFKIKEVLSKRGYNPQIDENNDLIFRHEGWVYIVQVYEDDPLSFRIMLPNFWLIESEAERKSANHTAQDVTYRVKVAKVFLVKDQVWISVELFLSSEEGFITVLDRCMSTLSGAANLFGSIMNDSGYVNQVLIK